MGVSQGEAPSAPPVKLYRTVSFQLWFELLGEFEYVTGAERTAIHRGTVEIPSGVKDDTGLRFRSVGSAGEGVNHVLDPSSSRSRRQLEHNTVVIFAPCSRRAVEISCAVEGHAGPRRAPVCADEVVQHMLGPLPQYELQLEDGSISVSAAGLGGSVQASGVIENQCGGGVIAVLALAELIKHGAGPVAAAGMG